MSKVALSNNLSKIRDNNKHLVSYNIEMTEVTGGTFWKSYTPKQVAGEEEYSAEKVFSGSGSMMEYFPPIDLSEPNIRKYAKALDESYIRVSGSWASHTYYDFDGKCDGNVPEGYHSILTKEEWLGVLDFVKEVNGKLLISFSNCPADHVGGKPWTPEQAKLIIDTSKEYGVPVSAIEFMNEPNLLPTDKEMEGYSIEDFARDQDACFKFIRDNYPDILVVGPCTAGDPYTKKMAETKMPGGVWLTKDIISYLSESPDVFSYHCYGGVSERGAIMGGHWDVKDATSEPYLYGVEEAFNYYLPLKEQLSPGAEMWVTETAGAACGGNTWDSTYLDVIRYADELGRFSLLTSGISFRNTLASSDYGLLDHKTHLPRPAYWFAYLWNQIMGSSVYEVKDPIKLGQHVYAHSRKDGKDGLAYLIINNSETDKTSVDIPSCAVVYVLSAEHKRDTSMFVNGMKVDANTSIETVLGAGKHVDAGTLELGPLEVAFVII